MLITKFKGIALQISNPSEGLFATCKIIFWKQGLEFFGTRVYSTTFGVLFLQGRYVHKNNAEKLNSYYV